MIGDVHLGCSDYTDKRVSDFTGKFVEAINLALERGSEVVVLLGDIFDSSAYRRSIDSFANFLHEIAPTLLEVKSKGVPIVAILGNHEYGRGREGGEIRILADLGFVHLLADGEVELKGQEFFGISWKSDIGVFNKALTRFQPSSKNSILLIHQFVKGSRSIPQDIAEVDASELKGWRHVFVGHHHVHESFGNVTIPGSLEISNVLEIGKHAEKGFVIYDTESGKEDFVELKSSRAIRYVEVSAEGLSAKAAENTLKDWIIKNAEPHALLVAKLIGKLSAGRSSEIDLRSCRVAGIQGGCLDVYVMNAINDPVRTASGIRSTMKVDEFLRKWFKRDSAKALEYFDEFREAGDDFAAEIRDRIVEGLS